MSIDEAKQLLWNMGFDVAEGQMCIDFEFHQIVEPVLGVFVSDKHQCFDGECKDIHLIGTKTALSLMSGYALRKMIAEQLVDSLPKKEQSQ